jgi:hypothetical protein
VEHIGVTTEKAKKIVSEMETAIADFVKLGAAAARDASNGVSGY